MIVGGGEVERAVAERLLAQGDEVRVVVADPSEKAEWIALGVHVAVGDPSDDDLIDRAGQNARTLILFDRSASDAATVDGALKGAAAAGIERVIVCAAVVPDEARRKIADAGVGYALLAYGRRLSVRGRVPPARVAEAVDAADDLSGEPRLELDLREPGDLRQLGLGHTS